MEIPENIYKTLETVENGQELISSLKAFKSSLNDEAKTLRQQRNLALETIGINKDEIKSESFQEALQRRKEEMLLTQKELETKAKAAEEKGMTETQRLQRQIEEQAQQFNSLKKSLSEKDMQIEISNRNREIEKHLKSANVSPQFIDDLSIAVQSRIQKASDGSWKYNHNGELKPLSEGIAAHLQGKDSVISVNQKTGGDGKSGQVKNELTPSEMRSIREKRIKRRTW